MHSRLTTLISVGLLLATAGRGDAAELGKIMPLGDSITAGYTSSGGVPGGYRQELYNNLTAAGHSFQLVGSETLYSGSVLESAGQNHHEGHNAYSIQQISDGIANSHWLNANPDIILLHIGANDILEPQAATAPDRFDALLGVIFARQPNVHVIAAEIIGGSTVEDNPVAAAYDAGIVAYNAAIAQKVAARVQNGQQVSLVDMYGLMNINHQMDEQGQLLFADTSHPNQLGYNLMGDAWAGAIKTLDVPEPGVGTLLTTGLIGLLAFAWRKEV